MGIRSDVALCMKNQVYQELSATAKATINDYFGDFEGRTEEGLLFAAHDIKWYYTCYADLMNLYKELYNTEYDDYLLLTACCEYPGDTEADTGGWFENPWDITKQVNVSLEWSPR